VTHSTVAGNVSSLLSRMKTRTPPESERRGFNNPQDECARSLRAAPAVLAPPPALGKRRHRSLSARGIAMCRTSILMMPDG
jgi:hypothetical protein